MCDVEIFTELLNENSTPTGTPEAKAEQIVKNVIRLFQSTEIMPSNYPNTNGMTKSSICMPNRERASKRLRREEQKEGCRSQSVRANKETERKVIRRIDLFTGQYEKAAGAYYILQDAPNCRHMVAGRYQKILYYRHLQYEQYF